jgi:hypothetical protein
MRPAVPARKAPCQAVFHAGNKACFRQQDLFPATVGWPAGREEGNEMSAFEEHREELQHYETMMGPHRGRLAVSLDLVTNALVLVGQHGIYCHSARDRAKPALDIQSVARELTKAKELIQSVMEEIRVNRGS